jgi:hypothetical protein
MAAALQVALTKVLGLPPSPVSIQLHPTLESFRNATGQPFWVSAAVGGTTIHLTPAPLIAQREGMESVLRLAIAELLVGPSLADRPAWATVGAARHFARQIIPGAPRLPEPPRRLQCPSDAELRLASSIGAQREAESRAEMCFVRALAQAPDWRAVR